MDNTKSDHFAINVRMGPGNYHRVDEDASVGDHLASGGHGGLDGGHITGQLLARDIWRLKPKMKIAVHSGTLNLDVILWFRNQPNCKFFPKVSEPREFARSVASFACAA